MKFLTSLVFIALLITGCTNDKRALPPIKTITHFPSDTLIVEYAFIPLIQPLTIYKYINATLVDSVYIMAGYDHVYAGVIIQDGDSVCFKESGQPLMPYRVTDSDGLGYINPFGWYVNY